MSAFTQWSLAGLRWAVEHPNALAWAFGMSLVLLAGSLVLIPVLIARMRPDYFVAANPDEHTWLGRHRVARATARALKNVLGGALLLAGVAMMVLPGQGIITVLAALSLLEFPGKRALELRLIRKTYVSKAINWIRAQSGHPPLIIPAASDDT